MSQSDPPSVASMLATVITTLSASTTDDYSSYIATLSNRDVLCVVAASTADARYDSYALATFRVTSPCTSLTDSQMVEIELEREEYLSKYLSSVIHNDAVRAVRSKMYFNGIFSNEQLVTVYFLKEGAVV